MYLLAEDPPLGLQMVQMGQGLSHGKELQTSEGIYEPLGNLPA